MLEERAQHRRSGSAGASSGESGTAKLLVGRSVCGGALSRRKIGPLSPRRLGRQDRRRLLTAEPQFGQGAGQNRPPLTQQPTATPSQFEGGTARSTDSPWEVVLSLFSPYEDCSCRRRTAALSFRRLRTAAAARDVLHCPTLSSKIVTGALLPCSARRRRKSATCRDSRSLLSATWLSAEGDEARKRTSCRSLDSTTRATNVR